MPPKDNTDTNAEWKDLVKRLEEPGDNPPTDEELSALQDKLKEAAGDTEDLELLEAIADAADKIRTEQETRAEAAAEAEKKRAELLERINPKAEEPDEPVAEEKTEDKAEDTPDGEKPDEGKPEAEAGEKTDDEAKEPVAASVRPSLADMADKLPATSKPRVKVTEPKVTITAAGDVPGVSAGSSIDEDDVGTALQRKAQALSGSQSGGKFYVATYEVAYPEDRALVADASPEENQRKIDDVLRLVRETDMEAIVAAGGICAPLAPYYDLFNASVADRPVRDKLVRFGAERGGINFVTPPTLSDVSSGAGIWTAAQDASPGSDVKGEVEISCGSQQSVTVDAIYLRIKTSNLARRTFSEGFRAWWDKGRAYHARLAEGNLLKKISDASTAVTDAGVTMGAARDLLENASRFAAQYRNTYRMRADAPMDALFPAWARDLIASDLLFQLPGDATMNTSYAEIDAFFRARNINVGWYLDTRTSGDQLYSAQAAGTGKAWVSPVEWYLFAPDTFLFVDGGTLDLGIDIRDSALNATNKVAGFMETFENVAFIGEKSLRVRTSVCVNGATGATKSVTCAVGGGS